MVIFNCFQKVLQKRKQSVLGHERKREVYVSASNKMEVRLVVKRPDLLGYFLLKYEGKDYFPCFKILAFLRLSRYLTPLRISTKIFSEILIFHLNMLQ